MNDSMIRVVLAMACAMFTGLAQAQQEATWKEARQDPLAALFPAGEIKDVASLDLKRLSDEVIKEKTSGGAAIRRIEIEFTSQIWAGETWRHRAALFIPADSPPAYRDAAMIFANGQDSKGIEKAKMGLAAVVLFDVPGKRYAIAEPGNLMGFGDQKFMETGEPRWLGYPWLARIYMRGITAAQSISEFGPRRFVVTGGSKWGVASWIATAVDDRIVGGIPTSWNIGNMDQSIELRVNRMGATFKTGGANSKAPSTVAAGDQLKNIRSPRGKLVPAYMDPYVFRDRLAHKPVLFMDGSNDPLFCVDNDTVFLPHMTGDIRICLVPNKGHAHPAAIQQTMWVAHVFAGRDVPRIELAEKEGAEGLEVTATVSSKTQIKQVTFWSAAAANRIYVDAEWKPAAMKSLGRGKYQATLPRPSQGSAGYIVMVEDEDPTAVTGVPGQITTGFNEWPRAKQ